MIKKLLVCSISLCGIGQYYSQHIKPDSRLEVKYSKKELQEFNQEDIHYLNYCIENAYLIMPVPEGKDLSSELMGNVDINNLDNINFFDLGIVPDETTWKYYRINNKNKLFVVLSKQEILRRMKANK